MTKRLTAWILSLLGTGVALAAPTKSVRVTTYQELAEGQVNGVLLSSHGEARSGFSAKRPALPALGDESVRAMAIAAGGTVYLGTGGDVPAVLLYGSGQNQAAPKRLAKLDAGTFVTALCPLSGAGQPAGVLAATAQDGRIFRVRADGQAEVVAQVEGEHVWAMTRDESRGVTYVVTGPGALWAVEDADLAPLGKGGQAAPKAKRARKIFSSDARQFLALDRGEDGALYVGTADDAVLYRIDPKLPRGGVRALHDFAGNEVRAIAHYKDVLYVAVNDMQRGDTANRGTKIVPPAAGTVPGVKATPPSGSTTPTNPSPIEKKGKGALYRIEPSGRVEQLHAIVDGFFNALAVDAEGNLFAAASTPGGRGHVYWVAPSGESSALPVVYTALEVKESDVLTLSTVPGSNLLLAGTGNSGALYVLPLHGPPPANASYTSKAFYVQAESRWGSFRFHGQGVQKGLRVETHSGNLAKPDDSWSAWQPLSDLAWQPATDEQAGKIASPPGRYLQVRFLFGEKTLLRDFTFYYQPINQRPRVTEILVGEDSSGRIARGARMPGTSGPLRPRSPIVRVRWKVENPDEDELNYRVYVRKAGGLPSNPATGKAPAEPADAGWLRIGGPDPSVPLVRPEFEWNTETVADGLYELKVEVSDERSNPPELALTHELVTAPFLIDNQRPEVRGLSFNAGAATLSGRAVDSTSPIAELSYAIDGGDFYPLQARDGVLDDPAEDFTVHLNRLSKGLHTVLVRASDAAENTATAQIVISP